MAVIAVIVDIVGSRLLADRATAQEAIHAAFADAHRVVHPVEELWATVGDEFQTTYAHLHQAILATALVRLSLPGDLDCRFGLGWGEVRQVERTTEGGGIQDGSAWWNAREAISAARGRERGGHPYTRTWFVSADSRWTALVNAYLLGRDHTIARMKTRERRLALGLFSGLTQESIARSEGITQSAVSQGLQRSGATALALGMDLLLEATPP